MVGSAAEVLHVEYQKKIEQESECGEDDVFGMYKRKRGGRDGVLLHQHLLSLGGALQSLDCPLTSKDRGFEELFAAVLLIDEALLEVIPCDRREEEGCRCS